MKKWRIGLCALLLASSALAGGNGLQMPDERARPGLLWNTMLGQPDGEADYQTGLRYLAGEGVARDQVQGLAYLRKAAEAGHPEACFNLGNYYNLFARQPEEAARWWREAARRGHAEARDNVAEALRVGLIKPQPGDLLDAAAPDAPPVEPLKSVETPPSPPVTTSAPEDLVAPKLSLATQLAQSWADLPGGSFTVQLMASLHPDELREVRQRFALKHPLAVVSFERAGQHWHALILGQFASQQAARQAVQQLPGELQAGKPWVRRLDDMRGLSAVRFEALAP